MVSPTFCDNRRVLAFGAVGAFKLHLSQILNILAALDSSCLRDRFAPLGLAMLARSMEYGYQQAVSAGPLISLLDARF